MQVVPAQAGVIPDQPEGKTFTQGGPRASGGDPLNVLVPVSETSWSPRKRG